MADLNSLLNERLGKKEKNTKVTALGQRSASGQLTGLSGLFSSGSLSDEEREILSNILQGYANSDVNPEQDLQTLIGITSEVKAITNQAALLHGERIKCAHDILIQYQEGAFTAWLVATYGNRQTPYNLWQYFEFYHTLPKRLQPRVDVMPRQAVYTLATRQGEGEEKERIVEEYDGETKQVLLNLIRERFPLASDDKRRENLAETVQNGLEGLCASVRHRKLSFTKAQKQAIRSLLHELEAMVGG